jgi:hypothetical protein
MLLSLNPAPETARELPSGILPGLKFGDDLGSAEALMETMRRAMEWLHNQRVVAIGGFTLPPEYLTAPVDEVLYVIERLAVDLATHLSGDDEREDLHVYLALAASVAPYHTRWHAVGNDRAGRLTIMGEVIRPPDQFELEETHAPNGRHRGDTPAPFARSLASQD